jgi:glycerophosphoryl diester phosphodiesterase
LKPVRLLLLIGFSAAVFAQSKYIAVIAHRGEHLKHPENTIAAFQAAAESGADYFELDVRTTADGKFVLMHDGKVDRMTNGKGDVETMTFDEIRKLEVGLKMGPQWAGTRVPTFDEALAFASGKIGVYVDSKRITAAEVVAALERHGMQDHVVVYGGTGYLKEVAAMRPNIRIMPEANSLENLRTWVAAVPLKVAAFDARDFQDDIIAIAKQAKVDIFVDRLGPLDNPASWQQAIDRGATGIQTDHPAELVQYLKSKGYR